MATIRLTQDFKEFLQLLDSEKIEYLFYPPEVHGLIQDWIHREKNADT